MLPNLAKHFPRYTDHDPAAPIYCVTPQTDRTFHRFFDTSPFSPSGRFIAFTRLPFEDRMPQPGDVAEITLVDLETGEERPVAESRGWDTQLGAQVQWGADDTQLCFNDLDVGTWMPFCVIMDPVSGAKKKLDGTVYMVSPDGKQLASPCLRRTGVTQAGYGVLVPPDQVPQNPRAADDDGVFVTDTESGSSRLLVSIKDIVDAAPDAFPAAEFSDGAFWGFHVKWNLQGDRIQFVLRWIPADTAGKRLNSLVTMRADGSDIHVAMPGLAWAKGGHHPNWCPDGEHVMMNLKAAEDAPMRFVRARYDGTGLAALTDAVLGSGHPAMHPNGRHIVTDAYPHEKEVGYGDGTVPIRLVDIETGEETTLARIQSVPPYAGPKKELRIDPHPAWDYSFQRVAFNGCPNGTRRVYVADLAEAVK